MGVVGQSGWDSDEGSEDERVIGEDFVGIGEGFAEIDEDSVVINEDSEVGDHEPKNEVRNPLD